MIISEEHTIKEYKRIGDSVIKISNKYMVDETEFNIMMELNTKALMFEFTLNLMADAIRKHCDCKNIAEELIDKCYRDALYKTLEVHHIVQFEDRLKRVPPINGHEGEF